MRRNHKLAVGFIEIGGDFGEKLHRGDTGGSGQLQLMVNGLADLFGHQRRRALAVDAVGDVKIGLIKREGFNQRGVA